MAGKTTGTLAVLIDGDNASPRVISGLLAEIANYGTASVKRVYGDWTGPSLKGWKDSLLEHALQPIQQFAYTSGKNATDGAMIIDAMDLLYSGRFAGFCIVSSDSDFTRLAARLREQGAMVYGFGERKTPRAFITACDKFVYFDVLDQGTIPTVQQVLSGGAAALTPSPKPKLDPGALEMLSTAVKASADEDGWANLGAIGSHLVKQSPDFDARNYGFSRLSDLATASGILEVRRVDDQTKAVTVRLKPKPKSRR